MKKMVSVYIAIYLIIGFCLPALAAPIAPDILAPAAVLMEKETGQILFEKDADTPRLPASVTKVMTLLLAMEAIERGSLRLDEKVTISLNAQNMGGSQVYMAEGEQYTVEEILKSVVIASGNDAAVALAEHMAGSEETFVGRMNEKASELGMNNTFFRDCTGLADEGHATSARDIAIMSRALLGYPQIKKYTTVWMDTLRGGTFGLNNTNKLIRFYPGASGLKTGSTSKAGFCLSGSAEREGMELIAVILGADSSASRFEEARALLDFGFANFSVLEVTPDEALTPVPVLLGKKPEVLLALQGQVRVLVEKNAQNTLTKEVVLSENVQAPVMQGQKIGELTVKSGHDILTNVDIVAVEDVGKLSAMDIFGQMIKMFFLS